MSEDILEIANRRRVAIKVNGIVQGVGFRPFIYKLAQRLSLTGFVTNSGDGVEIEIEGAPDNIEKFLHSLEHEAPPLSDIAGISAEPASPQNSDAFRIIPSKSEDENRTLISPDVSVCDDCLKELFDRSDRRYHYPFINCTNCGPRFTIIRQVPYDRPYTSMADFRMCPQCQGEYDDPLNRRFHAQPNACPECGPQVWFERQSETGVAAEKQSALDVTVGQLLQGRVIAIKGLGGFHLTADATNETAVQTLRRRKNREEKPLAIMLPDPETVEKICTFDETEKKLLESPQRPIVLLKKRRDIPIAESVAPGNRRLGVMLPYTPLHYILMDALIKAGDAETHFPALVMTSANLSEEPIVIKNDEARQRLDKLVDGYLFHDREILIRADDSVMMVVNNQPAFLRRSRSYVPRPVFLKQSGPQILAAGAELKNTICILKENRAFLSQHIGDLENLSAYRFFEDTIEHMKQVLDAEPELVVYDMHPNYFSSRWAQEQNKLPRIAVQHHHAHLAAIMAEWQLDQPLIGIILDGTGYGYDKTIWGGEILVGDYTSVQRYAHLEPLPLPGGKSAIEEPWRSALSYLYAAFGKQMPDLPFLKDKPVNTLTQMIDRQFNSPLTSSCGRLFDAVSVIAGGREDIRYEAQAAIELTQSVGDLNVKPYDFVTDAPVIPLKAMISDIAQERMKGATFTEIATRFHKTLAELFTAMAIKARKDSGLNLVALSGGVFQNEILLHALNVSLKNNGFEVYTHKQIPANDGGIALGQAAIGQQLLLAGKNEVKYEITDK